MAPVATRLIRRLKSYPDLQVLGYVQQRHL